MRVDGHVDVPLIGFEEVEVKAGQEGGDAHVEFCVRETRLVEEGISFGSIGYS